MNGARRSAGCLLLIAMAGCSSPPSDERYPIYAPERETFPAAGDVLESHCGSLDCHGSNVRNLRLYGFNGLRLDGVTGTGVTTSEEYDASYLAVIAIEPEMFSRVVAEGGRDPARLTLVRKARGTEAHKGGAQMPPGSDGDTCLTSWLAGAIDTVACQSAAEIARPPAE